MDLCGERVGALENWRLGWGNGRGSWWNRGLFDGHCCEEKMAKCRRFSLIVLEERWLPGDKRRSAGSWQWLQACGCSGCAVVGQRVFLGRASIHFGAEAAEVTLGTTTLCPEPSESGTPSELADNKVSARRFRAKPPTSNVASIGSGHSNIDFTSTL